MIEIYAPTTEEVRRIAPELVRVKTQDRIIFKIIPLSPVRASVLKWKQKGVVTGLMQPRGIGGAAPEIELVGDNEYQATPGYYGETVVITEEDLIALAGEGRRPAGPLDATDKVMDAQEALVGRRIAIQEWLSWQLLTTGLFAVAGQNGQIKHKAQFTLSGFTSLVPWSDHANATPLADWREAKLKFRGSSTMWDRQAWNLVNQTTLNHVLSNRNAGDLAGLRVGAGSSILTLKDLNDILVGEGIPPVTVVEDGWHDEVGDYHLFVPDDRFVAVGRRPDGEAVGEFQETIAVQNDYEPGAFTIVEKDEKKTPPKVSVTDGFNGGPVLFYPRGIVVGDVAA
jgi:hypothetical protein